MYFFRIISFIKYFFNAKNEHSIQAPFLFKLYTNVIKKKSLIENFKEIEQIRKEYLSNDKILTINDLGAFKGTGNPKYLPIKMIVSKSVSNFKKSSLQFRLIQEFKPKTIIELGTSLGVNTLYMSLASQKDASIYTLEGSRELVNSASTLFNKLKMNRINIIEGDFDSTFEPLLFSLNTTVDYLYIDGNHRYEPTLRYFNSAVNFINQNTVFVLDDIHWSKEMEAAWNDIILHQSVTVSVDLFDVGIIFFSKSLSKQNFVLRY
jgi:hypothetical protein